MKLRCLGVTVASVWLLGIGCAGDGTGLDGGNGAPVTTLSGDVQPIFTENCSLSGCHIGPNPQEGQDLSTGRSLANVVNVPANQLSTMNRVAPGEPDNSYLVHKVQGTHQDVGGSGDRMPEGRSPLSQSQINLIRAWIEAGALNN